ncbi:hypothetical protein [Vibrio casei]|uniref:hypothetical protein n=1 Tax=Vibrio casei TaxID=673372 RepID=UPI003F962FB8
MGWLHATPEKREQQRYRYCGDGHPHLVLPDIMGGEYVAELWQSCGVFKSGGMGAVSLDWQDMHAFSSFNEINGYEADLIIKMSRSYVNGINMREVNDPPPYKREYSHEEWLAMEKTVELIEAEHHKKEMRKLATR